MNREYIPFKVMEGDKKGIWHIDITYLSVLELIKLREAFKYSEFSPTINALDKLIYNNIEKEFNCSYDISKNGYYKKQKRNREIRHNSRMKKVRRRKNNDKY